MANGEDPERAGESTESGAQSESANASERARSNERGDTEVSDLPPREELKQSFDRDQLIRKNIDRSIDTVLRLNPVENILKNVDQESPVYEQAEGQVESMMNEWLDMYRDTLEEGRTLPADLIGRSAELARESRENPRDRPESSSRRR